MKPNTLCYIIDFDEMTRQECHEILPKKSFSSITIKEKGRLYSKVAWQTTIVHARIIRKNGIEQGKKMSFKVAVAREDGTLRFAKASEWIIAFQKKESLRKAIKRQIERGQAKKLVRGRLGVIS